MAEEIPMQAIENAVKLSSANPYAKKLFELIATKQRNSTDLNIDFVQTSLGIGRNEAISVARSLESMGLGRFVIGRKGARTRLEWAYNAIDLSKQVLGSEPTPVPTKTSSDRGGGPPSIQLSSNGASTSSTVSKAKEALALELGIPVSSIEIKITL